MSQKYLGEFEEVVLLTIGIIYQDAYGASIRDEIQRQLGRVVRLGALHATLVRLEKKGLITSYLGEATSRRGGKRKRYYQVTAEGKAAVRQSRDSRSKLWDALSDTSFTLFFA
ncbi:MAG: helix-turn-helix transcriptional regulator [Bacteroidota bacterium]